MDGVDVHADDVDALFLPVPLLMQPVGDVEAGLPAHRRQHGVGPLPRDDLLDGGRRQLLKVDLVGGHRVGHDGGRVGVDQNHLVAFGAQRPAGLGARIVKLAGLSDDDRP